MEPEKLFMTGREVNAADFGATEKWFFPRVVHLRLRDHSLLKFAPGLRDVPTSLFPAEKEILLRYGANPAEPKQAISEAELASGASQGDEGTQEQEDAGEGLKSGSSSTKKVSKK